jgi:hypothetical protein
MPVLKAFRKNPKNSRKAAEHAEKHFRKDFYHGWHGFHGWKTRHFLSVPSVKSVVPFLCFYAALVKKTYLTSVCLTRVSTNKIKGFVPGKNPSPEGVENWPLLLNWERVRNAKVRIMKAELRSQNGPRRIGSAEFKTGPREDLALSFSLRPRTFASLRWIQMFRSRPVTVNHGGRSGFDARRRQRLWRAKRVSPPPKYAQPN